MSKYHENGFRGRSMRCIFSVFLTLSMAHHRSRIVIAQVEQLYNWAHCPSRCGRTCYPISFAYLIQYNCIHSVGQLLPFKFPRDQVFVLIAISDIKIRMKKKSIIKSRSARVSSLKFSVKQMSTLPWNSYITFQFSHIKNKCQSNYF